MTLQGSYLRVNACYEDNNTTTRIESLKQNLLIPNDTVLVKCPQIYHQAIYDLCLREVKRYQSFSQNIFYRK